MEQHDKHPGAPLRYSLKAHDGHLRSWLAGSRVLLRLTDQLQPVAIALAGAYASTVIRKERRAHSGGGHMNDKIDLVSAFDESSRREQELREKEQAEQEAQAARAREDEIRRQAEIDARLARTPRWLRAIKSHPLISALCVLAFVALIFLISVGVRNQIALSALRSEYPRAGASVGSADELSRALGVSCVGEPSTGSLVFVTCGGFTSSITVHTDGTPSYETAPSGSRSVYCEYSAREYASKNLVYGPNWESGPEDFATAQRLANTLGATLIPFSTWCQM